jgi:glucose-1-phosphate adenylyltransferase
MRWASANDFAGKLYILDPGSSSYLGTADAVYQNIDFLEKNASDLVLVLAGDHVYKMDYQRMIAYHRQTGADATVAVIPVPIEEAYRFGIVSVGSRVRITGFVEKPEVPQGNLISMGIYVFNKRILIDRLIEDAALPYSPHDFGHAIMPGMIRRDSVAAYKFSGYWRDIGTQQAYYEANMEILPRKPSFSLNSARSVLTGSNHSSPPKISGQGSVQNSLVGPGCVIKGHVENSVISPGVRVEEEAVVTNTVIMANTSVGYHTVVDHCILGEGVNVGKFCYLGLGGSVTPGKRSITVLGDGVTVPPHTAIGRNCRILPHSGQGDFLRKVVPSNSTVPLSSHALPSPLDKEREEIFSYVNKSLSTP